VLSLQDWDDALGAYFADHDEIGTDADARGPALLTVEAMQAPPPGLGPTPDQSEAAAVPVWNVRQTLADPAGDHDWVVEAVCDLPASDEIGEPMLLVTALRRMGG
jgi:hypothetical protein